MQNEKTLQGELIQCPNCLSSDLTTSEVSEHFSFGLEKNAVELSVRIPVHYCKCCGMSFTDESASELKHDEICRHLGVMLPRDVRSVRGPYSQQEFAAISKLGRASIARWESGSLVQSPANDNYLYLLSFPDNLERLREREQLASMATAPKFGSFRKISAEQQEILQLESEAFELF